MTKDYLFKAVYLNENFPPPFKNSYTLTVSADITGLSVNYALQYLERDTLTEEEIFNEGFTSEDDFQWKGTLNASWQKVVEDFLLQADLVDTQKEDNSNVAIYLPGKKSAQYPENSESWEYFLQELTQAIFEEAKRESPLEIHFIEINGDKKVDQTLRVSFADRRISLTKTIDNQASKIDLNWKETRNILTTIYAAEYLVENASAKAPKKEGRYIEIGEGLWYQFGVSVKNPSKRNEVLGKIERIFRNNQG